MRNSDSPPPPGRRPRVARRPSLGHTRTIRPIRPNIPVRSGDVTHMKQNCYGKCDGIPPPNAQILWQCRYGALAAWQLPGGGKMGKCRLPANPGLQPSILVQWFVVRTESYFPVILDYITPRAGDTDWHMAGGRQGFHHPERLAGRLAG